MEKTTVYSHNYKNRTIEVVRTHLQYIIIGAFAVSFISAFSYATFYQKNSRNINTLGLSTSQKEIAQSPEVEVLTKKLQNQKNSYSSPKPTKYVESGEISSISSARVTYRRSKYIVQEGDSLRSIALQVYGDENAWVRIVKANNLPAPDAIEIGMELLIPR